MSKARLDRSRRKVPGGRGGKEASFLRTRPAHDGWIGAVKCDKCPRILAVLPPPPRGLGPDDIVDRVRRSGARISKPTVLAHLVWLKSAHLVGHRRDMDRGRYVWTGWSVDALQYVLGRGGPLPRWALARLAWNRLRIAASLLDRGQVERVRTASGDIIQFGSVLSLSTEAKVGRRSQRGKAVPPGRAPPDHLLPALASWTRAGSQRTPSRARRKPAAKQPGP